MKIVTVNGQMITNIDHKKLHSYIINKISIEFSNLVENCYYPKIAECYRDLLHMTNTNQKALIEYTHSKYKLDQLKILNDPQNTIMILIVQEFLNHKDLAAAEATFHLLALRHYSNLLYKYTTKKPAGRKLCLPDVFQSALDQLSRNHIISKQKTIPNSIIYLSRAVFQRYLLDLKNDNSPQMVKMLNEIRHRLNQSLKSFFHHYYEIAKNKNSGSKSKEEEDHDTSHETKVHEFSQKIAHDICVYGNVKSTCVDKASQLLKFNKNLSKQYSIELSKIEFKDNVELSLYLLLKNIDDMNMIKSNEFLDYIKGLMAIKVTKQTVYFKQTISQIHDQIIKNIHLEKWYSELSIQSKSLSRNYIAYYLACYLQESV